MKRTSLFILILLSLCLSSCLLGGFKDYLTLGVFDLDKDWDSVIALHSNPNENILTGAILTVSESNEESYEKQDTAVVKTDKENENGINYFEISLRLWLSETEVECELKSEKKGAGRHNSYLLTCEFSYNDEIYFTYIGFQKLTPNYCIYLVLKSSATRTIENIRIYF